MIPPLLIQILVENAIWHGLNDLPDNRVIKLCFSIGNDLISCTVIDNGIGVANSKEKRREFGKQASKGISLIREKIKILEELYKKSGMGIVYKEAKTKGPYPGTEVELKMVYRDGY